MLMAGWQIGIQQGARSIKMKTSFIRQLINLTKNVGMKGPNRKMPNKTRDFAFKFFNNMLGLNTRLAHFVDEQRRACDLCGGGGEGGGCR
jgi:hypothetical protein